MTFLQLTNTWETLRPTAQEVTPNVDNNGRLQLKKDPLVYQLATHLDVPLEPLLKEKKILVVLLEANN